MLATGRFPYRASQAFTSGDQSAGSSGAIRGDFPISRTSVLVAAGLAEIADGNRSLSQSSTSTLSEFTVPATIVNSATVNTASMSSRVSKRRDNAIQVE